ncbi:MAG: hypothetical protein ACK4GQ_04975 [Candidatus Hadarchaeales archaeon]
MTAHENGAGVYDDTENRRALFLFNFEKRFNAVVHFELLYEDNYQKGAARTTSTGRITWWEWREGGTGRRISTSMRSNS